MSFLAEIKRRNVHRVMVAYGAGAWLLIEIMDLLTGVYEAPSWVMKVFVAIILAGIIPAAIVSWFYELTPEGLRKETDESPAPPDSVARKFNLAILAMLAAAFVIVLLFSGRFGGGEATTPVNAPPQQAERTEGPPMVAVLPFDWASLEGDSKFFANGIHDDLLTQLARLKSLRVISRTSVMEFQGVERNLREIGRILGADAILEGGIQRAGDRIRINAQLIDARTDEHLWANTFDRELSVSNIFDVQTEIARAIAQAMQTSLSQADESTIAKLPTENMAAYRAFHEAMEMRKVHGGIGSEEYNAALRRAVELDPGFTHAWSALVGSLSLSSFSTQDAGQIKEAEDAIARIAEIAPDSVDHLVAQAYYTYYVLREYDLALGLLRQAMTLAPSNVELYSIASWVQRRLRDWDGQIESLHKAWELDPRDSKWPNSLSTNLAFQHRYDEARAVVEQYLQTLPVGSEPDFSMLWEQNFLEIELNRDLGAYLQAMRTMHRERPSDSSAGRLWEALVANRKYDQAWEVIEEFGAPALRPDSMSVSFQDEARALTAWLRNDPAERETFVEPLLARHEAYLAEHGELQRPYFYLRLAMLRAAAGQEDKVVELYRHWDQASQEDAAERWLNLGLACFVLAMAELGPEAAVCLRAATIEPTYFYSFIDPWQPYFDPVRESPEFQQVFSELEAKYGPMLNWP